MVEMKNPVRIIISNLEWKRRLGEFVYFVLVYLTTISAAQAI
jgi:hypothetical protein